jgi:hypothetical protein
VIFASNRPEPQNFVSQANICDFFWNIQWRANITVYLRPYYYIVELEQILYERDGSHGIFKKIVS